MNRRTLLALASAAALLPMMARADAPEVLEIAGRPVVALAAHATVGPRLRTMSAGRQRAVSAALRGPGPVLTITDGRWIHGYGCAPEGCAVAKVFLAFDTQAESVVLLLLEGGRPSLFIPPRIAPWPAALEPAIREFDAQIAAVMRFTG